MPNRYQNILPDPQFSITPGGFWGIDTTGGVYGQPFASVQITDHKTYDQDRTISGKLINRTNIGGQWIIKIQYNPMTKAQFDPIYSFLLQKRGGRKAFFVSLPQYLRPASNAFNTYMTNNDGSLICPQEIVLGGTTSMELYGPVDWDSQIYSNTGLPSPGDMFTFPGDLLNPSSHTKAYKITHVETELFYKDPLPTGNIRIHFTPGFYRPHRDAFVNNLKPRFINPLIRVVEKDLQEYSLDSEGLYSYTLQLEEALF